MENSCRVAEETIVPVLAIGGDGGEISGLGVRGGEGGGMVKARSSGGSEEVLDIVLNISGQCSI